MIPMRSIVLAALLVLPASACELLIKYNEATHPDPVEDMRGRAKRGMVVQIREDGASYGERERQPRFAVIKVPGVAVAEMSEYLAPELDGENIVRYRRWQFMTAGMPQEWLDKIASTGTLTVRATLLYSGEEYDCLWDELRQYLYDHQTDTYETRRFVLVLR